MVRKVSGNLVFSRNITISQPKVKVNYILLMAHFRREAMRGIFTRKFPVTAGIITYNDFDYNTKKSRCFTHTRVLPGVWIKAAEDR